MQETLQMQKKALRREILARRETLPAEEREKAAVMLTERILGHQWFYLSDTILGFASYGSEIPTDEILQETLHHGKSLYLPKVDGEVMQFYRVNDLSDLQIGYKGIREPLGNTERYEYREDERALLLVPGVAFDPMRYRLGYGKGFYDRFLADKPALQLRSIAVGYRCQMTESVPHGETDIKPYQVIVV